MLLRTLLIVLLCFTSLCRPVYSRDLQWLPGGSELPDETSCRFGQTQEGMFEEAPRDVEQNILLAKLRPGQVWLGC